ncbi:MAG TPA: hemolysin III family protein [Dermatophilaceae bacterium]|jgi:hemolysin III|nr:hemolysin III family protein [Dermatophilaceae bacterium]HPZ69817.1 hemolysin III family protein [Dermatophilaceae bacterium]HQD02110.1 hemolysin III family protein [Dermatophilaceae bacterium]
MSAIQLPEHLVAKPRLRGWLHAGTFPVAVIAGLVLIILAPAGRARIGAVVFVVTAAMLFGTSAVYHRGTWSHRVHQVLKRVDHSNIFLIIAGSYTPFALCLLPTEQARTLLITVWAGALGGVAFRVLWVNAPRWLYTPIYVALGWVAVFYFTPLLAGGGAAVMTLIVVGGVLYTVGAVVYGTKRPNPSPRWFGFHEVFHACTVAAFITHFVAVSLAAYTVATA